MKTKWKNTTGTVIKASKDPDGVYDYEVKFRVPVTGIEHDGFDFAFSSKYQVDETVTVLYDPEDPGGIVKINPDSNTWNYATFVTFACIIAGLILTTAAILHFLDI